MSGPEGFPPPLSPSSLQLWRLVELSADGHVCYHFFPPQPSVFSVSLVFASILSFYSLGEDALVAIHVWHVPMLTELPLPENVTISLSPIYIFSAASRAVQQASGDLFPCHHDNGQCRCDFL